MSYPTMPLADQHAQRTFRALVTALSYPGTLVPVPPGDYGALGAVAQVLLDLETSYCAPDPELARWLNTTGARAAAVERAAYQFYPQLAAADLAELAQAPVGSYMFPDTGATLVLGCTLGSGAQLALRGPGIADMTTLHVADLPAGFWQLRADAIRYPLGWDVILCAADTIVGLPRTTQIVVR